MQAHIERAGSHNYTFRSSDRSHGQVLHKEHEPWQVKSNTAN